MNCCINIVTVNKPKLLTGLDQKVCGTVASLSTGCALIMFPPVQRQVLTPAYVTQAEHGKPIVPPKQLGKRSVRKADGTAGKGLEKKRMPFCNGTDTG